MINSWQCLREVNEIHNWLNGSTFIRLVPKVCVHFECTCQITWESEIKQGPKYLTRILIEIKFRMLQMVFYLSKEKGISNASLEHHIWKLMHPVSNAWSSILDVLGNFVSFCHFPSFRY